MIPGPDISSYLISPELAKRSLTYQLKIAGEPQENIVNLSYEADGPAMVLDCTLPFRLPSTLEGKEVTVDLRLGPGLYRTFTGEALRPEGKSFQAASGSFWDPILDEDTTYSNAAPRSVAYSVLRIGERYAGIDVPLPETPKFTRVGENEYPWITKVSEVLDALEEEAQLTILDDGRNVARGFLTPSLESPGEPEFSWNSEKHLTSFTHSARFQERYSEVRVYTTLSSGQVIELARAEVDNGPIHPPKGQILPIEVTNSTAVDLSQRAREQAYQEAIRRAHAPDEGDMDCVFIDPRIERADSGRVAEVDRSEDEVLTTSYGVVITSFSHTLVEDGNDVKTASYSYVAQRLSETFTLLQHKEFAHESVWTGAVMGSPSVYALETLYPSDILYPGG